MGEGPELYQALAGLFLFHQALADMDTGAELAAELLSLGERAEDAFVRRWAHIFSGLSCFYRGDFEAALIRRPGPGRRF